MMGEAGKGRGKGTRVQVQREDIMQGNDADTALTMQDSNPKAYNLNTI